MWDIIWGPQLRWHRGSFDVCTGLGLADSSSCSVVSRFGHLSWGKVTKTLRVSLCYNIMQFMWHSHYIVCIYILYIMHICQSTCIYAYTCTRYIYIYIFIYIYVYIYIYIVHMYYNIYIYNQIYNYIYI